MNLHNLKPAEGSVRNIKRVGRGQGSGRGGTSTRGHKGAQSRSGYSQKRGFEGGQMPLQRRLPKFGFTSPNRVEYKAINLDTIQEAVTRLDAKVLDHEALLTNNLAKKKDLIKVLNRGELSAAVEIHAHKFSKSAIEAIEKAGGKAVVIDRFAVETADM
ncbi:50S ribosomal protein L15 [Persicitalea jodogahamensis]|uniref:Large ribosomal subunit protein uL15 n=1 Tax=Persicitalea jodogahamensis TaxID=402147 RepID=A0A8J3D6H1_9BACT|nr:50S ribosomal protein L15 [Persicitalea jodogahamensis]GHB53544.1 50S ribosomal protein L15 [Persicitalea jodogahamensis]